jgi:hypothetical protein
MQVAPVLECSVITIVVFNGRRSFAVFHNFPNLMEGMFKFRTATVTIYLNSLVQRSVSISVLYSNYYSIKWYHDLNLHSNPCDDKLISVFLEGGHRASRFSNYYDLSRTCQ